MPKNLSYANNRAKKLTHCLQISSGPQLSRTTSTDSLQKRFCAHSSHFLDKLPFLGISNVLSICCARKTEFDLLIPAANGWFRQCRARVMLIKPKFGFGSIFSYELAVLNHNTKFPSSILHNKSFKIKTRQSTFMKHMYISYNRCLYRLVPLAFFLLFKYKKYKTIHINIKSSQLYI